MVLVDHWQQQHSCCAAFSLWATRPTFQPSCAKIWVATARCYEGAQLSSPREVCKRHKQNKKSNPLRSKCADSQQQIIAWILSHSEAYNRSIHLRHHVSDCKANGPVKVLTHSRPSRAPCCSVLEVTPGSVVCATDASKQKTSKAQETEAYIAYRKQSHKDYANTIQKGCAHC